MTQRDRTLLAVVMFIALAGGYWFLLLAPKRQAAADAESKVTAAQQSLQAAQQRLSSGQAAQERFRKDRQTVVKLGRVVPTTDDTPTVLTQLSAIARKHDITFLAYTLASEGSSAPSSVTETSGSPVVSEDEPSSTDAVAPLYPPGSVTMDGGLGRTPLTIQLRGSYFDLERFLRAVQRFAVLSENTERTKANGRLFIVDGINYAPIEGEGGAGMLTAELHASVYFAPKLETPATSATGVDPAAPVVEPAAGGAAALGGIR